MCVIILNEEQKIVAAQTGTGEKGTSHLHSNERLKLFFEWILCS